MSSYCPKDCSIEITYPGLHYYDVFLGKFLISVSLFVFLKTNLCCHFKFLLLSIICYSGAYFPCSDSEKTSFLVIESEYPEWNHIPMSVLYFILDHIGSTQAFNLLLSFLATTDFERTALNLKIGNR